MYVYIYIYTCMYVYTYIYLYIYIYICTERERERDHDDAAVRQGPRAHRDPEVAAQAVQHPVTNYTIYYMLYATYYMLYTIWRLLQPMRSEPPTPARVQDKQLRQMQH